MFTARLFLNTSSRTTPLNSFKNISCSAISKCKCESRCKSGRKALSPLDVSFSDYKTAFRSKSTWELVRAYLVYQICSVPFIVNNNMAIMKATNKVLGDELFIKLMKNTFYGHFVAGENEQQIKPVLFKMQSFGVYSILDYSVEEDIPTEQAQELEDKALDVGKTKLPEYQPDKVDRRRKVVAARTFFYENEKTCDKNKDIILKCIETIPTATNNTGMAAIKLTALGRPQLLLQLSEVITRTRRFVSELDDMQGPVIGHHMKEPVIRAKVKQSKELEAFLASMEKDEKGEIINMFPWSGVIDEQHKVNDTFVIPDFKTGEMVHLMTQLSETEVLMFHNLVHRFNEVIELAANLNVRVMVDAEQTYFQPAISRLTVEMMRKYNRGRCIVYNTYQNYLKGSYEEVVADLEQSKKQNFNFCCKLVRGAYMEQERERALEKNYPDPVHPSHEATSLNYHRTLGECLKQIKHLKRTGTERSISIIVASHNEDTVRYAVQAMQELGIAPDGDAVGFGQLLGMCDFISFSLGQAGYMIYKYVPYGPVKEVLPYLSRRASENKGVLKNVKKEKNLLRKEILRRMRS